jgi:hypothetical protein
MFAWICFTFSSTSVTISGPKITRARCITIHIKRLLNVGLSQYRCGSEELLQSEKGIFALRAPFELGIFLLELGHWLDDLREVWNESVVISR